VREQTTTRASTRRHLLGIGGVGIAWLLCSALAGDFLLTSTLGCLLSLGVMRLAGHRRAKVLWFNTAMSVLALGVTIEILEATSDRSKYRREMDPSDDFWVEDENLGHRARANQRSRERLYYDGELLFDAVYTTDEDGLRAGPPRPGTAGDECVLFFGCSNMFGEGVEDLQTLPTQFEEKSGGRYRARNFGVPGYGPHQMLAMIESGRVEEVARCTPVGAVYEAIDCHVERAAGEPAVLDGPEGPRFVLDTEGTVRREGRFPELDLSTPAILGLFDGFEFARNLRSKAYGFGRERNLELFGAIVSSSRQQLEDLYPGIAFHVLYWGEDGPVTRHLESLGLPVHPMSDVLPYWADRQDLYSIPHDGHPTPLANEVIASYVAERIFDAHPGKPESPPCSP